MGIVFLQPTGAKLVPEAPTVLAAVSDPHVPFL